MCKEKIYRGEILSELTAGTDRDVASKYSATHPGETWRGSCGGGSRADRRSRPDEAMFACDPKPVNYMVPSSSMNLMSLTAQGHYKIVTREF